MKILTINKFVMILFSMDIPQFYIALIFFVFHDLSISLLYWLKWVYFIFNFFLVAALNDSGVIEKI